MRRLALPTLVILLAACAGGTPPPPNPALANATPVEAPPIFGLLGQREVLGLNSAQVTSLDSIGEALRNRNKPVEDSLRAFYERRGRPRSLRAQQEIYVAALPVLTQLWANNRSANEAVRDVLTPPQRDMVCRGARERDEQRRARLEDASRRDPRLRSRGRMDPDSLMARTIRGWTWCRTAVRPDTTQRAGAARADTTPAPASPDTTRPAAPRP
jgi:hypothetical protein